MTVVGDVAQRTRANRFRWPVAVYLSIAFSLYVVVWMANAFLPNAPEGGCCLPSDSQIDYALDGWVRYDSGWYLGIAEHGYSLVYGDQSAVAFFPAYPLAIRALSALIGSPEHAGIAITFLSGLAIAVCWWEWLRLRVREPAQRLAFVLLLVWPYAWYLYGAVYADALFIMAALAAFVLLEHDRPIVAGIAGAVATAARPVGVAVLAALLVLAVTRRHRVAGDGAAGDPQPPISHRLRDLRPADAGVLVAGAGIGAWCIWLWVNFADPLAFSSAQGGWGQELGMRTLLKVDLLEHLVSGDVFFVRVLPQAVATVVFLGLVPRVVRRFGWAYGLYTLIVLVVPAVGSSTFHGTGRYLLAAFPVFAVIAEWLAERPALARLTVVASGACLAFGAALYGMGWYLA